MKRHLGMICTCGAVALGSRISAWAGEMSAPSLTLDVNPETAPPGETAGPASFPTGDWFGLRKQLQDRGVEIGGLTLVDMGKVLRGGLDTGKTPVQYLLDLNLTIDTEKAWQWKGGTAFLDFEAHDGPDFSATAVGDMQGVDTLNAPRFVQIYQLWYQQVLFDDKFRVRAGKIDANIDFSVIDHAKEFLQATAAYSVPIYPMVTYPDPAPGLDMFFSPNDFYMGFGAFYSNSHQTVLNMTGHPEAIERTSGGTFLVTEAGARWKIKRFGRELSGHAGVGGWYHTGEFPRVVDPAEERHGSGGAYFFADQALYHEDATKAHPEKDLGVFVNGGWSDPQTNPIDEQLGAGVAAGGLVPFRPGDIVGLFGTWSHMSAQPENVPHRDEVTVECFYKVVLAPWASLKPDFQYVVHPSGRHPDAAVFILRAEIDF